MLRMFRNNKNIDDQYSLKKSCWLRSLIYWQGKCWMPWFLFTLSWPISSNYASKTIIFVCVTFLFWCRYSYNFLVLHYWFLLVWFSRYSMMISWRVGSALVYLASFYLFTFLAYHILAMSLTSICPYFFSCRCCLNASFKTPKMILMSLLYCASFLLANRMELLEK